MNHNTYVECVRSLFRFHNESLNVWTHLLGCLWFFYRLLAFAPSVNVAKIEDMMLLLSIVSCIWCLAASTWFHLCLCLPCPNHYECILKTDMSGIMIVIFTLYLAAVCLTFGGGRYLLQLIYIFYAAIGGVIGMLPLAITRLSRFAKMSMLCFAYSAILPTIHWAWIANPEELWAFLPSLVGILSSFSAGAVFYFTAWPECHFEGKCDYFFHSHQWWHILVFCGLESAVQGISALHSLRSSSNTMQ